jgi:1-acyl-sn-glycerol-3-phosphate acyltransferase
MEGAAKGRTSAMRDPSIWSDSIFPVLRKLQQWGYLRIDVEGLQNIPQNRPFVMVANHGGWFALDGLVIPLAMSERVSPGELPYGIVEDVLWKLPLFGPALKRMGSVPRSVARDPGKIPAFVENIGIFPEGSEGNCKPFWQAYQMRPWKTGFARLAHARQACVLPIAVIGLEECLPVLWKARALKRFLGTVVPIPLLPLPMPTQCKVIFGDPIDLCAFAPGPEQDPDFYGRVAHHCQGALQAVLDREAANRPLARLARRVRGVQKTQPSEGPPLRVVLAKYLRRAKAVVQAY